MTIHTVVITKTEEESTAYGSAVVEAGFQPLLEPVLNVEYLDATFDHIGSDVPLVFTSSYGVRAFAQKSNSRANPIYTVGRSTAETARFFGFSSIDTAAGKVDDLVELLLQRQKTGLTSSIYIRADEVSKDFKGILANNSINMAEIIAYKAIPAEKLSLNLLKSIDKGEIYAVMLFSNKGARVFGELIEQYGRTFRMKSIKALCISDSVVESVSVLPFQQAIVAGTPDRHGMMELLDKISVNQG